MQFPWEEFTGLVERLLEILEDPLSAEDLKVSGQTVLASVYHRVSESSDDALKERVMKALKLDKPKQRDEGNPKSLRQLISWIAQSTDPGSLYVLRRTDKLGSRSEQEMAIRSRFGEDFKLWFAPERHGQKSPAMAFIAITDLEGELAEGPLEIEGKALSIRRFHYEESC